MSLERHSTLKIIQQNHEKQENFFIWNYANQTSKNTDSYPWNWQVSVRVSKRWKHYLSSSIDQLQIKVLTIHIYHFVEGWGER